MQPNNIRIEGGNKKRQSTGKKGAYLIRVWPTTSEYQNLNKMTSMPSLISLECP